MDNDLATKTPTFRKLNKQVEAAAAILDQIMDIGADASFDQLRELMSFSVADAPEDTRAGTLRLLHEGLGDLEHLAGAEPHLCKQIRTAALLITIGLLQVGTYPSSERIQKEAKTIKPILSLNNVKAAAVKRAQAIATELWQADTAQEIRLGDMAERVYRALADEGFAESLPGTAERLKEWIKPAAPDYARKGGRRRKTP